MAAVLTPPFAVAAVVLCVAGLAKLRAPQAAVRALTTAGLPGRTELVRAVAMIEVALGACSLLAPSSLAAAALAATYAAFAALSVLLARRRAACGCFGEGDAPASPMQSLLSGAFAIVALAAAASSVHGLGWVLATGPLRGGTLLLGIAAAAYGAVVAYTQLPQAWAAWSAR
jgi:hypothetical protein